MALLLGGANVALAEESGGFVGIGIGGGGTALKVTGGGMKENIKLSGINYGFVGGYKQFFTPHLGLRYYVNVDLHHNMSNDKKAFLGAKKPNITLINYGVNVDFLGNFVSNEMLDFGGFIGLGIGGNTLAGKAITDNIKAWKSIQGAKVSDTGLDVAINVGLRTNIAKHHGVEVAVRVPLLPVTLLKMGDSKGTFGQEYSVLARYAFSF